MLPEAASIARRWFSRAESDALARLSGGALLTGFALWTHREAAIKALGASLEVGLGELECALDPDGTVRLVSWRGDQSIAAKVERAPPQPCARLSGRARYTYTFQFFEMFDLGQRRLRVKRPLTGTRSFLQAGDNFY